MSSVSLSFDELHADFMRALLECRVHSGKEPVHNLRKQTRRLEALLRKLLEDHAGADHLHRAAGKLLRWLRRVRRLAGRVRDIDVHLKLLDELAGRKRRTRSRQESKQREHALDKLTWHLHHVRERKTEKLRKGLEKHELRLERALKTTGEEIAALSALGPMPLATARNWVQRAVTQLGLLGPENLHDLRKQTKLAWYLAELQPAKTAQSWARRIKAAQDAIGRWHDLDLLLQTASTQLSSHAPLVGAIQEECVEAFITALKCANKLAASAIPSRQPIHD